MQTTGTMEPTTRPDAAPTNRRPDTGGLAVLWKGFGAVMVVLGLWWGTYNVVTLLAHEERVENESFPAGDVTALDVRNATGSVRVVATETDTISVQAEISDGLRSTGESRDVVDGVLQLHASCPNFGSDWCRVTYRVEVPRDLPVAIDAANGRVEVTGVEAGVDVDADNGTVELTALSGPIDASTDNGRVVGVDLRSTDVRADSDNGRVILEFAVAPVTVEATTNNGSVEVVVPDTGESYRVSAETRNGSRNVDDIRTDPASDRSITLQTDNGSVTARAAP